MSTKPADVVRFDKPAEPSAELAPFSVAELAPLALPRNLPAPLARNLKRAAIAAPLIAGGFALLWAGLEYLQNRGDE